MIKEFYFREGNTENAGFLFVWRARDAMINLESEEADLGMRVCKTIDKNGKVVS